MITYLLFTFVTSNWGPDVGVFVTKHVTNLQIHTTYVHINIFNQF
jgi:hypothetical protein